MTNSKVKMDDAALSLTMAVIAASPSPRKSNFHAWGG